MNNLDIVEDIEKKAAATNKDVAMQKFDVYPFIDNLKEKAAEAIPFEEGDYMKDGVMHCHKCNTPKQHRILGGDDIVSIPCKCRQAENDKKRAAFDKERNNQWMADSRKAAFPQEKMHKWRFENDDGTNPISANIKLYAQNFKEICKNQINGLLLYGATGTGKSFLAACVVNELIDHGIFAKMTSFDRIRNELQARKDDKQKYIDHLAQIPLLVIDDLAAESSSEWMQEIVFSVINAREQSGKPMLITSNITASELKNPANPNNSRIYSRILGMCQPIEIKGADRRHKALAQGSRSLKDIMGL